MGQVKSHLIQFQWTEFPTSPIPREFLMREMCVFVVAQFTPKDYLKSTFLDFFLDLQGRDFSPLRYRKKCPILAFEINSALSRKLHYFPREMKK